MKQLLIAGALCALALGAQAQQHTVYVGGAYIDVHSKADPLAGGSPLENDARVDVNDAATVGFGYTYRYSDAYSFEVALGVPPRHHTDGRGQLEGFGQVASFKQGGPTVFANYHFGDASQKLRPFVGAGINYTHFWDGHNTVAGNWAAGGPTTLDLKDSWGLAAHGGLTYSIDKHWSLIGTLAYAQVKSDLTATTTAFGGQTIVRTTSIDFRPLVYTASVGYTF